MRQIGHHKSFRNSFPEAVREWEREMREGLDCWVINFRLHSVAKGRGIEGFLSFTMLQAEQRI